MGALASPRDCLCSTSGWALWPTAWAVNVTVSGKSCQHELRGDVVVCPLPPPATGKDGAPLQVGSSVGPPQGDTGWGSLQAGPELPPNAPQACVGWWVLHLGKVVRPGLKGSPEHAPRCPPGSAPACGCAGGHIGLQLPPEEAARVEPSTAILTQPSPPNHDASKPLSSLSVQALGVCPHLLGLGRL